MSKKGEGRNKEYHWKLYPLLSPPIKGSYLVTIERMMGKKKLKLMYWDGCNWKYPPRKVLAEQVIGWMEIPRFGL